MNITIFIGGISGGGAERVACNLANYLSSANHSVTMLNMSETDNTYNLSQSVKVLSLLKNNERKNKVFDFVHRYFRLRNYVKKEKCDCFLVMLPLTISFLLHFKNICKSPVVAAERCDPNSYPKLKKFLMKKYGRRADGWVFQTENAAKWYVGIARHSIIIPNAINPSFIRNIYTGEREKSIVSAGRLSEQKNFKLLIEAFSAFVENHSEYFLKIYGKGPLEAQLKKFAEEHGVADKVKFMGYVDNMPEELEKSSMFVLPSDYEGMPNALMEAMALGLPCIATDCDGGGARFLIKNGENGLLVPKCDVVALTNAMKKFVSDEELSISCGEKAGKISQELNFEKIYGIWEKYISEIISEDK